MKGIESNKEELLKKKYARLILIEEFIENMAKKYQLSFQKMCDLYSTIIVGFSLKSINKDSITIKNNSIKSVEGISFSTGDITYNLNIYKSVNHPSVVIKDNNYLADHWLKYLAKIKKLLSK